MEKELKFQKDDIIEYCDEHFIVLDVNYSNTGGIVAEWNGEQPGQVITNFNKKPRNSPSSKRNTSRWEMDRGTNRWFVFSFSCLRAKKLQGNMRS